MKAREAARAFTSSNISLVPGRRGRQPLVGAENAEGPALEPGLRFSLPRRSRRLNLRRVVALVNPRLLLAALTYYSLADAAELLAAGCLPRQALFLGFPLGLVAVVLAAVCLLLLVLTPVRAAAAMVA